MIQDQLINLLETAIAKRQALRGQTNALRLVNGWGDGLEGLFLEQYDRHFAAQIFDKSWLSHGDALASFLKERLNAEYFIVKDRSKSASPEAITPYVWIDAAPSKTVIHENSLKFSVDLNDGLNSGLFLDMRCNRRLVSELSRDKKVLNCFSYTCSFGVYCRREGAGEVVNVDISRKSLERGRANYELNGLAFARNEFIKADAREYLERAAQKDNRFDLIILDPPSFARHEGKTFSVKNDFADLVSKSIKVLNPGGVIFLATNYSAMSEDNLNGLVHDALAGRTIRKMRALGQDADFPGTNTMQESYLAAVLVEL
ncbi:MAG: class I SAM-dependent rRNA methyltransferase [Candidatus Omnitrophica bacterium]|nr:class I SAM-dependent rRNA methyltransferase [Candidatus Omnitrophota bacterium]